MQLELKILTSENTDEFIQLINIFSDVFEMDNLQIPSDKYLEGLLKKSDFLVVVGISNQKVVGGLTVYLLQKYYTTNPVAYIYDLGVKPEFQRKGIGGKIISHLIGYCKENGIEDAYVEAESDDNQAINFYKKTAPSSTLQATHFTYLMNESQD